MLLQVLATNNGAMLVVCPWLNYICLFVRSFVCLFVCLSWRVLLISSSCRVFLAVNEPCGLGMIV